MTKVINRSNPHPHPHPHSDECEQGLAVVAYLLSHGADPYRYILHFESRQIALTILLLQMMQNLNYNIKTSLTVNLNYKLRSNS